MSAWAHLPNAPHIDRILEHVAQYPLKWSAAWDAAHSAAWDAAWGAAHNAAWDAAWGAARGAARGAAGGAAWGAAGDALAALVAWDDCADLLCLPPDVLRARINLVGNDHAAALLLPAAIAMQGSNTE